MSWIDFYLTFAPMVTFVGGTLFGVFLCRAISWQSNLRSHRRPYL